MERGDGGDPLWSAIHARIGGCPATIGTKSVLWSGDWPRRGTKDHKVKERERERAKGEEKDVERGGL